jgi:acyl-CoA dehydrogenase
MLGGRRMVKRNALDFNLTAEQEGFRRAVREFCQKEIAPRARAMDTKRELDEGLIDMMAAQELLGITIPPEYGGPGADFVTAALVAEEIARADVSCATAVMYLLTTGWSFLLTKHATNQLKEELLPKVAKGKSLVGILSTEPQGGSDIAGLRTRIAREPGKLVVNGQKSYISLVREIQRRGGGYLTLGSSEPSLGHRGMTAVYMPLDRPGVSTGLVEDMGRMALSTGNIDMKKVELPEHYIVGEWNKGFYVGMEGFQAARVLVSAACIGCWEGVLDMGMSYTKERETFGTSLAKYEGIQFPLVDSYAALEADRLLVYRAAWAVDEMYRKGATKEESRRVAMLAAQAKLRAPVDAFQGCSTVMDMLGAYGYTTKCDVEMALRGVKSYSAGAEGGQNIMRIIIAREILGDEFVPQH